ncbi:choline-binding protein [Lactobacillus sp. ESL0701]|uniref:choline-binding protein n=1 Tax=Lactobacillus sp. ESL0701 TaxID=2983217 RepID=UPI0023F83683|nr:choline-binding protein [Lactobacillus sp. ESL0701]MDF7673120.1 choline-binding protein [Lactobacillus sp. ESL0701]
MLSLKNHFWGKSILAAGTILALSGTTVVSAAKGPSWTVSHETVSARGNWSSYGSSNVKRTNSNDASFNGDVVPNWNGYLVKLINSNATPRSSTTQLWKDVTTYGRDNTGTVNYAYYADVRSTPNEPNSSYVKLHFSSDHK